MPPPPTVPPWRRPWRFPAFWVACVVLLALGLSGAVEGWRHEWRATQLGVSRLLRPQFPDPNNPTLPFCLLFARHREDPASGVIPPEGRFSEDPAEMTARLARLMALLATLPPEYRPRAVALDMVLAGEPSDADPYLAEAMAALPSLVLAATEEPSAPDGILRSNEVFRVPGAREALDTFGLPAWTLPSSQARLYADAAPSTSDGRAPRLRGLGAELAFLVKPELEARHAASSRIPLYYWNLLEPGALATARSGGSVAGLWPAEAALLLTHVPLDEEGRDWEPMVPDWEAGESPAAWLGRVRDSLGEDRGWGPWSEYAGALVAGRLVMIGVGHPGDRVPTPFTSRLYQSPHRQGGAPPLSPGPVLHALTTATLLQHRVPCDLMGGIAGMVAVLLAGFLAWLASMRLRPGAAILVLAGGLPLLVAADLAAEMAANVWLPVVPALLGWGCLGLAGMQASWALVREGRDRTDRWIRRLVPTTVLSTLDEAPSVAGAAGETHTAWRTVLRTDMAGYTDFVRGLEMRGHGPLAMELVSAFFMDSVPVLDRFGGRLTDLTGDGLVALFDQAEPVEESCQAFHCGLALIESFRDWRAVAAARCTGAGLSNVPIPGLRVAIGASDTSFRLVGTEQQQKPLFFGGSFILSARIEAKLKELPLPEGADPLVRFGLEGTVAGHLAGADLGPVRLAEPVRALLKGLQAEVEIVQVVVPLPTSPEP